MSRYLPERMRDTRRLWLHGIALRAFTIHLGFGLAVLPQGAYFITVAWVCIIEALAAFLFRRVKNKGGPMPSWVFSWIGISDAHFFLMALLLGYASGLMPKWGYLLLIALWAAALFVEFKIAQAIKPARTITGDFIATALEKRARTDSNVRQLANLLMYSAAAIIAAGFFGVVIAYALSQNEAVLLSLSVMGIGLAVGSTGQTRGVMLAYRFRNLPWS